MDIYHHTGYSNGYLIVMQAGDWMNYTADVAQTGTYTLQAKVAWGDAVGGTFHVEVDGVDKTGSLQIPNTGWGTQTITKTGVAMTAGRHVLKVVAETNASNGCTGDIDNLVFVAEGTGGGTKLTAVGVTASASHPTAGPQYATDGNLSSAWVVDGFAPQWIQLDLGQSANLSQVRLSVQQDPAGQTVHEVWGGATPGSLTLLGTLSGYTQSGQWLELTTTAQNVRYVRVVTTGSPSWVAWNEVEVYGSAITQPASPSGVQWLIADQLGTPRMVIEQSGALSGVRRHDYLPIGEEIGAGVGGRTTAQGYVGDSVRQKWVGYERDGETGLDYAQARYYASMQGRFTSVDPALSSGKPAEPQSWNRYTYVLNNPLLYTDPTGLIWGYKEADSVRTFQWFDGDKVGDGYTAYNSSHFVGSNEVLWLDSGSSDYLRVSRDNFSNEEFASLRSAQGADSTSFSQEQLNTVNRGIAETVGRSWQYGLMKGVAAATGGIAGGLGAASNFTFGAASRQASRLPPVLFHYTNEAGAAAIEASQLGRPGGQLFLTNNGGLTPLQAQLELSLPAQSAPRALFAVDSQALSTSNLLRSGRVTGNVFGRPGGGFEFQFSKGTTVPQGSFTRFRF